jgi:hypothetical protein
MMTNDEICDKLHHIFKNLTRYQFPFNESLIPNNGIYVLFEKGEKAHGDCERIVRIGTHTGKGNLGQRLNEHFLNEHKDRSIFRKNIGRALLNKRQDPLLELWNIDLTTRVHRLQYATPTNRMALSKIEKEVSTVIRESFKFCVLQVDDMQYRMELEGLLIATVNQCAVCSPSDTWLGNYSPVAKIKASGLWLVQKLNGCTMSTIDLSKMEQMIR